MVLTNLSIIFRVVNIEILFTDLLMKLNKLNNRYWQVFSLSSLIRQVGSFLLLSDFFKLVIYNIGNQYYLRDQFVGRCNETQPLIGAFFYEPGQVDPIVIDQFFEMIPETGMG